MGRHKIRKCSDGKSRKEDWIELIQRCSVGASDTTYFILIRG